MNKCKYIKDIGCKKLILNTIYTYKHLYNTNYKYTIDVNGIKINEEYFNNFFVDIKEERNKKLNKLNLFILKEERREKIKNINANRVI